MSNEFFAVLGPGRDRIGRGCRSRFSPTRSSPARAFRRCITPSVSTNCRSASSASRPGTVLLPEMSRRFAAEDPAGAFSAQNNTLGLSLVLAAPFFIAFIMIPRHDHARRLFCAAPLPRRRSRSRPRCFRPMGFGLIAIVLIRSAVASFQARGDTKTPMYISLFAVAINVCLKIVLFKPMARRALPWRQPSAPG